MPTLQINMPTKLAINASTIQCLIPIINKNILNYNVQFKTLIGKSNIDQARSIMASEWYDNSNDDDLFMFIDSDQTFTVDDIIALINKKSDVAIGAYSRINGTSTIYPLDRVKYQRGEDDRLIYGPTGFMMIRKGILSRIHEYLKKTMKEEFKYKYNDPNIIPDNCRIYVSDTHKNVIPFFKQGVVRSKLGGGAEWPGEDYSFCYLVDEVGGIIRGYSSSTIGHEIPTIKYLYTESKQKQQIKQQPKMQSKKKKSITYYTYNTAEQWSPHMIDTTGIGGSETAVVKLSEEWVKLGYEVTVYGNFGSNRIEYNGVIYRPFSFFEFGRKYDVLIMWRTLELLGIKLNANRIFLDLHDVPNPINYTPELMKQVDKIFVKSQSHKDYFNNVNHLPDDKFVIAPNGTSKKYNQLRNIPKNPQKLIYSSSYNRGLEYMLKYGWSIIKKYQPNTELHIYYGWDVYDAMNGDKQYKSMMVDLIDYSEDVYDHGRVSQDELLKAKAESNFHYYIGQYPEIDCISVRESAYVGCIPIVSTVGCFKDENKDYCVRIKGDPTKPDTQERGASRLLYLMNHPEEYEKIRKNILNDMKLMSETWDNVAKYWTTYF